MDQRMMRELARQATGVTPCHQDDERFGAAMQLLEAFLAEHGRSPDPWADDGYEARLGSWLDDQRAACLHHDLPLERRDQLARAAGPAWESTG
ncbi:helicase associated domain-containing protein [Sinomonas atrocyanea]